MEDTIPDVIPCPDSTQSTSTTREEEMTSTSSSDQPKALNESILSLLLKIKTGLQSSSSSAKYVYFMRWILWHFICSTIKQTKLMTTKQFVNQLSKQALKRSHMTGVPYLPVKKLTFFSSNFHPKKLTLPYTPSQEIKLL